VLTVLVASVGVYLITTPGTLLQPMLFLSALRFMSSHYASGHGAYTTSTGAPHLWRMLEYFLLVVPSPYLPVAIGCTALAAAGALRAVRQTPLWAALVFSFPLLYVLYFSLQRVMIVRNLIAVAPFIAVAAALGAGAVCHALGLQ
jgi:hypothetical protein